MVGLLSTTKLLLQRLMEVFDCFEKKEKREKVDLELQGFVQKNCKDGSCDTGM